MSEVDCIEEEMDAKKAAEEKARVLEQYIFDSSKSFQNVPFTQFMLEPDEMAIGLHLQREVTKQTDAGVTYTRQISTPVVITSKGQLLEVQYDRVKSRKIQFYEVPTDLPLRWRPEDIKKFLMRQQESISAAEVYADVKAAYEEYFYFRPPWYAVHSLWDISTYFALLLPAFPYLELRGLASTAKTKIMRLSSCIAYNAGSVSTLPTAAVLFREVHSARPTLYIDEAEDLFRWVGNRLEVDERVLVLNSGYQSSGSVPRLEQMGKKWKTIRFYTYCPKMIASINGLRDAIESRCILHITIRAPEHDDRGESEIDVKDARWLVLRDKLYRFMMQHWQEFLEAYRHIKANNNTSLRTRDFELWLPLFATASLVSQELLDDTIRIATETVRLRKAETMTEDSLEFLLLQRMYQLINGGQTIIMIKDMRDVTSEALHGKTVSTRLDKIGLRDYKEHFEGGSGYRISPEQFRMIVEPVAPALFASKPSESSESSVEIINMTDANDRNEQDDGKLARILKVIEENDNGEGTSFEAIRESTDFGESRLDEALKHLCKIGDIYELPKGIYRILQ